MKKILLYLLIVFFVNKLQSQSIFSENWDGIGPGISSWTLHNVDALTPNVNVVNINDAWVRSFEEFDNNIAQSTSWYSPVGTSNDWLVSPNITIPIGTTFLYFDAKAYDNTYRDSYKVYVSTTGTAVASLTNLVFTKGDGTTGSTGENTTWTRRSIDLSSYAGQTINIGFQNFSNDMFLLGLDNISVINNATCLSPERSFSSSVTQTSATLSWNNIAGASYQLAIGTPGFIPNVPTNTSSTNSFTFGGLIPNTRYQIYVKNSCGGMWIGPLSVFTARVLPYTYGFETIGGYNTDGWSGGFTLNNTAASTFYADGSQMVFSNTSSQAITNRFIYSRPISLSAGEIVTLKFSTRSSNPTVPTTLTARVGNAPLPANQTTNLSTVTVVGATFVETTSIFTAVTAGTYYFSFNHTHPIIATNISLVLDKILFTSVLSSDEFISNKFSISPNPTNSLLNINSSENIGVSAVSITDLNGRVIRNVEFNGVPDIQLNVSDLSSGMYMLNIKSEQGTATKKFIKN